MPISCFIKHCWVLSMQCLIKPLLSNLIGTGLKKAVKKWLPFFASIRDECDNRWSLTKTRYKNGSTRSHHKEINLRRRVTVKLWSSAAYNTQQAHFYCTHIHTHLCSRSHTIWLYYTSSREIIFLYYMASFPSLLCTTNNRLGLSKNTEYSTLKKFWVQAYVKERTVVWGPGFESNSGNFLRYRVRA